MAFGRCTDLLRIENYLMTTSLTFGMTLTVEGRMFQIHDVCNTESYIFDKKRKQGYGTYINYVIL